VLLRLVPCPYSLAAETVYEAQVTATARSANTLHVDASTELYVFVRFE
jgi:hypothetical protein